MDLAEVMQWIADHDNPTEVGVTNAGRRVICLPQERKLTVMPREKVSCLVVRSLTSIVEWARDHAGVALGPTEGSKPELYALVVESPTKVTAIGQHGGVDGHDELAMAIAENQNPPDGTYDVPTARNILLGCANEEAHRLADLLTRIRGVVETEEVDALAQKVTISSGVATVEQTTLGIEHYLAPPTTFAEIEPEVIRYAVRLRADSGKGFAVKLQPLDQVRWIEATRRRIRSFLAEQGLEGVRVL